MQKSQEYNLCLYTMPPPLMFLSMEHLIWSLLQSTLSLPCFFLALSQWLILAWTVKSDCLQFPLRKTTQGTIPASFGNGTEELHLLKGLTSAQLLKLQELLPLAISPLLLLSDAPATRPTAAHQPKLRILLLPQSW